MRELFELQLWDFLFFIIVFICYIYIYIYIYIIYICIYSNLYNILGETLDKTQSLSTSFAQRLLQGRRIYRFISICKLCLKLEHLTPHKWLF